MKPGNTSCTGGEGAMSAGLVVAAFLGGLVCGWLTFLPAANVLDRWMK